MFKKTVLLLAALSVGACTVTPYKRPMDQTSSSKFVKPAVYARADDRGIGVQYFAQDSSAVGAPYGLIGALVTATMDAIVNSGPLEVAENGADALVPKFNHEQVSADFTQSLRNQLIVHHAFDSALAVQPLDKNRKWEMAAFSDDVILLTSVEYVMSQDFRSLGVVLTASAFSREVAAEQSKGKKKPAKDAGLLYRNRIEYHSTPLAAYPEKSLEEVEGEVASIKTKYGRINNSSDRIAMQREISEARKRIPADVKAKHFLEQWLTDDAARVRAELHTGIATVTELLAMDLQNRAPVDTKVKQAKTVVVDGADRVVVRYNFLPFMGAISSEPPNFMPPPANGVWYRREQSGSAAAGK